MGIEAKNMDKPDERRNCPRGHIEVVTVGGTALSRTTSRTRTTRSPADRSGVGPSFPRPR